MEVLYPHCAGLDVHKNTVVACVRHTVDGTIKREVRTFKTITKELLALSEWLAAEGCTYIAMEATGVYWKPVWHILSDGDFALVLANAAHVKNVPGRKTDVNDATWLADLLAHGLIRSSFVPDQQTQEMRDLRAPASSWCGSAAAMSSACKRRSKMPTSSSTRLSPM
jgi:transposase